MTSKNVYLQQITPQIPRMLGLLDRSPHSETYGCFDRAYWLYKTCDTPSARYQEAALTLALLYSREYPESHHHKNKKLLEWVNAALAFWSGIQEKDGSFNEWYPKERSFVATAFSSYAVTECLLTLVDDATERDDLLKACRKACTWLTSRIEERVANQYAGTLPLLYNMYELTGEEKYRDLARDNCTTLVSLQSPEGWFPEYGGADIGYHSVTIDYLAKYHARSKDGKAAHALYKAVEFLSLFIHPDDSAGGVYGSRNTRYIIPDGIEILTKENELARNIAVTLRQGLDKKTLIGPSQLDDRYLLYNGYTYLQAYDDAVKLGTEDKRVTQQAAFRNMTDSGLVVVTDSASQLIVNVYKGGAFRLGSIDGSSHIEDAGVSVLLKDGSKAASSILDRNNKTMISKEKIETRGVCHKIPSNTLSPGKNILLRGFQTTLGRLPGASKALKDRLRNNLIAGDETVQTTWRREITFRDTEIEINDWINGLEDIEEIGVGGIFSYISVPSSHYMSDITYPQKNLVIRGEEFYKDNKKSTLLVKRRISKDACSLVGFRVDTLAADSG